MRKHEKKKSAIHSLKKRLKIKYERYKKLEEDMLSAGCQSMCDREEHRVVAFADF
jgi:hypothetical protein